MTSQVECSVREFIVEVFLFGEGGDDLEIGESLLDAGIIDSSGILELVTFVEITFDIEVQDTELVPANFDSIAAIAGFVEKRRRAVA